MAPWGHLGTGQREGGAAPQTGEAGQCWHCRIQPGEQPVRLELSCEVRSAAGRGGTSICVQEEESCANPGLWHPQTSGSKMWASAVLRGHLRNHRQAACLTQANAAATAAQKSRSAPCQSPGFATDNPSSVALCPVMGRRRG